MLIKTIRAMPGGAEIIDHIDRRQCEANEGDRLHYASNAIDYLANWEANYRERHARILDAGFSHDAADSAMIVLRNSLMRLACEQPAQGMA